MTDAAPQRHETEVRGARLSWTACGEGPTVVWGHGMTSSSWAAEDAGGIDWSPVSDAGHRLVRYDARGHGESTGTPDESAYTWPALAQDLLALLDEIAPGEQVDGIGSSMGSATLIYAALADPTRFRRLVLTSAPTAWQTRAAQAEVYRSFAAVVETRGVAGLLALAEDAPAHVPEPFQGLEAPDDPQDVAPQVSEELLPFVLRGAALSDLPPVDALARLEVPVLLLPWADDPGHPVVTSEILLDALPDARMEVARRLDDLRGWGHRAAEFLR